MPATPATTVLLTRLAKAISRHGAEERATLHKLLSRALASASHLPPARPGVVTGGKR